MGALRGRSRPPPRVQKKNQPCLGSLAPSGLCRITFVPLFETGVDCTFPLPVPSGPPFFGPQGLLISWPDLREKTATHAQRREAMDSAAYYCGEAADKNARREGAGGAPRPVPPYERPDISSWPKSNLVERHLTLLQAEGDRVAVKQARKKVDVRARKGDDGPYLMTAGHHAMRMNGAGCRRVPAALEDLELPRGLHVAYPTVLS